MQGGSAREATVAKMCEEVEAHALYEKSAALARASGSCRLPKLRPSPGCPTGRTLASQQSIPLHQLMAKQLSSAAASAEELAVPPQNNILPGAGTGNLAAMPPQVKDMARIPNKHESQVRTEQQVQHWRQQQQQQQQHEQQHPVMLGREAQLLLAPYKPPPGDNTMESRSEIVKHKHAKPAAADPGVAVVFKEKYHRAGREVLGQHVDAAAAALTAKERTKHRAEIQKDRLGYTPLKLEAASQEHAIALLRDSSLLGVHTAAPCGFKYASAI